MAKPFSHNAELRDLELISGWVTYNVKTDITSNFKLKMLREPLYLCCTLQHHY